MKEELQGFLVVANFATTASDGKVYQTEHYTLDMVISVGYRVKSQKEILCRVRDNKILKDYLLKRYSIHNRINCVEDNFEI